MTIPPGARRIPDPEAEVERLARERQKATFEQFIVSLMAKGYQRNPCLRHCHEGDLGSHVHLCTPEGDDVIFWAGGRASGYDLTQPARSIYDMTQHDPAHRD